LAVFRIYERGGGGGGGVKVVSLNSNRNCVCRKKRGTGNVGKGGRRKAKEVVMYFFSSMKRTWKFWEGTTFATKENLKEGGKKPGGKEQRQQLSLFSYENSLRKDQGRPQNKNDTTHQDSSRKRVKRDPLI